MTLGELALLEAVADGAESASDIAAVLQVSLSTVMARGKRLRDAGHLAPGYPWKLTAAGAAALLVRVGEEVAPPPAQPAATAPRYRACSRCGVSGHNTRTCSGEGSAPQKRRQRRFVVLEAREGPDPAPPVAPPPEPPPLPDLPEDDVELLARLDALRPRTRGDCQDGPRPCPWVGCRWHLLWERRDLAWLRGVGNGSRYVPPRPRTDEELLQVLEQLPETCALDVADRGPLMLAEVGQVLGLVRERVRQIQEKVLDPNPALHLRGIPLRRARERLDLLRKLAEEVLP